MELGTLTPFTCPECHGSLVRITEGQLWRFRCHTGHSFTAEALLEGVMQSTGEKIWQVTRGLQEVQMLLEHMGQHLQDAGANGQADNFFAKAHEIQKRATQMHDVAVSDESLSAENIDEEEQSAD